jgi:hypothetical protein
VLGHAPAEDPPQVVAVALEGMAFGIAAAEVDGPVRSPDIVPVLDLPALVAGRRLVVDDG